MKTQTDTVKNSEVCMPKTNIKQQNTTFFNYIKNLFFKKI